LFHAGNFTKAADSRSFWQLQASIILQSRIIRNLCVFIGIVPFQHDKRPVKQFVSSLEQGKWILSFLDARFADYGDSIDDRAHIILGVHSLCDSNVKPMHLPIPPSTTIAPLGSFLWEEPFNCRTYAVSLSRHSSNFGKESEGFGDLVASEPKQPIDPNSNASSRVLYCLHQRDADTSIHHGSAVYSLNHLCPRYDASSSGNIFKQLFGIEFRCDDDVFVRPISPFEFVRCFDLRDDITYKLSQPTYHPLLSGAIPSRFSSHLLHMCHDRLRAIRDANLQIYDPSSHSAPAALANVFVNGAIGCRLPDSDAWKRAYTDDAECALILRLISNPALVVNENLAKVHHTLRMPLRRRLLTVENDMIIYREPLGGGSDSFCKLRLVPRSLRDIVFIAFHANPIGGHLNYFRTFKNIRL
jgi:hypothetical protein